MTYHTWRIALIAVLTLLTAGCQTTQSTSGVNTVGAQAGRTATVTSNLITKGGLFRMMGLSVIAVDNKELNNFWTTTHKVPSGRHKYRITTNFSQGLIKGAFTAQANVVATLRAGRRYRPSGKVEGKRVLVWLEDTATGKRVSTVGSTGYTAIPPDIVIVY
ncbi:MAG: hypothetical protein ACR2PM_01875 [Hyphomicrobiales bacterium]